MKNEEHQIQADDYTMGKAMYYVIHVLEDVIAMENQDDFK
jgi:ATP-dependent Clp protease adapter protein ClpS